MSSTPASSVAPRKLSVAAYQCRAITADVPANLARLARYAQHTAALGAQVLVLPEMYLTGYAVGDQLEALALEDDSAVLRRVADIARSAGLALVLGYPERRGSRIYNVASLWRADGQLACTYAKKQLFGPDEQRRFQAGDSHPVAELAGCKASLLICYDVEFPEPSRLIARAGAEVIFAPTANMQPYVLAAQVQPRARALENGLAMVYVNYVGDEGDLTYTGLSVIVGVDGEVLARAGSQSECLLLADIPLTGIVRSTQLTECC
jgi:predicted amidohydrolase